MPKISNFLKFFERFELLFFNGFKLKKVENQNFQRYKKFLKGFFLGFNLKILKRYKFKYSLWC